ncbi:hypothetical protein [Curvivirga sp.]|uniref:hypothetical protein n=1 Tax=Curvivirga sp. TaxID=2856848 RepID=UPI003B5CCC2E
MTKRIEELLPFYVNGTLSGQERAEIEDALSKDKRLQSELSYLQKLYDSMKAVDAEESPGSLGLEKLQQQIHKDQVSSSIVEEARSKVAPEQNNRKWKFVAVAACLMLAIQTSVFAPKLLQQDDLSAAGASAIFIKGTILSVTFNPTAREESIRDLLLSVDAHIVDGPSALGVYQLAVTGDVDEIVQKLEAYKSLIESVQIDTRN